ncbi:hypothetical protein [Rubrivirga sp.]|uniref:hypothetical protein n=1 Tax=Rubrivirga sp. TaxID=1885344 RepID=UPI003B5184D4
MASTPRPATGDAVARAIEEVGAVSGAYAAPPCAFLALPPQAEALVAPLRPDGAAHGAWVLVTVRASGELGQRVHLRERCLTAAQRVMLALSCDGVDNAWVGEGLPDAAAFQAAGADVRGRVPVGLVWCATG